MTSRWTRTHRLGGRVFVAGGVLLMAAAAVPSLRRPAVAVIAGGSLGLVVYSWVVWRRDPEKHPPAGRSPA